MMYRPEGFKESIWNKAEDWNEYFAYETGADAMLERLREDGEHFSAMTMYDFAGTLVFIPDEED